MRYATRFGAIASATLVLLMAGPVRGQVTPTSEWIGVWSDATTFNANPAPRGAVIRVYDPDGVQCGEWMTTVEGGYGLMAVYRDDPTTPSVDEGAEPGDALTFTVDGVPAVPGGPDAPTWSFNGDTRRIDLAYEKVVPTSEWISLWSDHSVNGEILLPEGSVVRAYDPDGVLCGEFIVAKTGTYGLMPVYRDDPFTPSFDEGAQPGDLLSFTIDGFDAAPQGPDAPVWSFNGDVLNTDLAVGGVPALLRFSRVVYTARGVDVTWKLADALDPTFMTVWRSGPFRVARVTGGVTRSRDTYRTRDEEVEPGRHYQYHLEVREGGEVTTLQLGSVRVPDGTFALFDAVPNPSAGATVISYEVARAAAVRVDVFDVRGRRVTTLVNRDRHPAGVFTVTWNGMDANGAVAPQGVYFARFIADGYRAFSKLTMIR